MRRALGIAFVIFLAAITYPGADIVAFFVGATPAPSRGAAPPAGPLAWLHVVHPDTQTPYIADDSGRMVLLHGAIPAGLIDFWSGTDKSRTDPPPYYPIDPAAYDGGKCPANSATIATPPLCEQDIKDMAAMGFNSVRLPMSWSLLEPQRGRFNDLFLDRVAQVVGWARDYGMYVILDMHQNAYSRYVGRTDPPSLPGSATIDLRYYTGAPAWATITDGLPSVWYSHQRELNPAVDEASTNFWYNRDGIQDEYIATVAHVMSRFKNDSAVAGISVFNEPWPGWTLPPGFEDLLLFPFYRRLIDAVTGLRDGVPCPTHVFMPAICGYPDLGVHDTQHLFFLDAGHLREITDLPTHLGLPISSYPNLVLGIHAYTHAFTIDTLTNAPGYPPGGYDTSYRWAEREAKAINAALFVTEFGNEPDKDTVLLKQQLAEQELHRTGFAFWVWKENCGSQWGVFAGPANCGSNEAQPSSGCIRADRVEMLARVYPEVTADPNPTYRYNPSDGSFTMRAFGKFGQPPTVVVVPGNVTGPITVGGAYAGEPSIEASHSGRTVTVYPSGGFFTIDVAPAQQAPLGCALISSPR